MPSFSDKLVDGFINHGWFFVWIVFFATIVYAFHEHGEHWADVKEAGGCARAKAISKLALLWLIPFLALLGAIASQLWADRADRNIGTLLTNFNAATNDLAIANRAAADAQKAARAALKASKPKPLDERLRIFLDGVDTNILASLKANPPNGLLKVTGNLNEGNLEQLQKFCTEPNASNFITLLPVPNNIYIGAGGMPPGTWTGVAFNVSTNLLKESSSQ